MIIGVAVINGLTSGAYSLWEILFANVAITGVAWCIENFWINNGLQSKEILYEKIELIKPDCQKELLSDLEQRTGLKIVSVDIGKIDLLRDVVDLTIYYQQA